MALRTTLSLALVLCILLSANAQFNPSKPAAKPVKSDIKYIKCQVCELLAKNAYRQVKDLQKTLKANQKVSIRQQLSKQSPRSLLISAH